MFSSHPCLVAKWKFHLRRKNEKFKHRPTRISMDESTVFQASQLNSTEWVCDQSNIWNACIFTIAERVVPQSTLLQRERKRNSSFRFLVIILLLSLHCLHELSVLRSPISLPPANYSPIACTTCAMVTINLSWVHMIDEHCNWKSETKVFMTFMIKIMFSRLVWSGKVRTIAIN